MHDKLENPTTKSETAQQIAGETCVNTRNQILIALFVFRATTNRKENPIVNWLNGVRKGAANPNGQLGPDGQSGQKCGMRISRCDLETRKNGFLVRDADLQQLGMPRITRTHTKPKLHTKKHSSSAWNDDDNSKSALDYLDDAFLTKMHDKLENPTTKSETTQQIAGETCVNTRNGLRVLAAPERVVIRGRLMHLRPPSQMH